MLFFEELCSKLNIDYSDIENNDLFSETELVRWLNLGKDEVSARYPWPVCEGKREIASVGGQEEYDLPTDVKSDSIRYLTVDDRRYDKLLFEDYLRYREDYDTGSKKFFSDRNRVIYINYLADDFSNSIVVYAQVEITGAVSSSTTTTVFTTAEPEVDEAIVKLAYSKALGSEKLKNPNQARKERAEGFEIIDKVWERIAERQHTYQTKDQPMFKRIDVVEGKYSDELYKRNQF